MMKSRLSQSYELLGQISEVINRFLSLTAIRRPPTPAQHIPIFVKSPPSWLRSHTRQFFGLTCTQVKKR
jgi:hypothetical protein